MRAFPSPACCGNPSMAATGSERWIGLVSAERRVALIIDNASMPRCRGKREMSWNSVRGLCLLAMVITWNATVLFAQEGMSNIAANNNRSPAGELRNGVRTIHLELGNGEWRPESDDGEAIRLYAFGEAGRSLQIPGPLFRVSQGTEIQAIVHNTLPVAATLYGLHERPGKAEERLALLPRATQEVRFQAGAPGTSF